MSEVSNYDIMTQRARELFLTYDQEEIIRRWNLKADEDKLYLQFLDHPVVIDRHTGDGAGFGESLALFDLLTLSKERPVPLGRWSSISELGGVIGAGHASSLRFDKTAQVFAGKKEILEAICLKLGGRPFKEGKGDVCYILPVFQDFEVLLMFWDADDEFPASLRFLFDANALQFMHYETLWYVMDEICTRLKEEAPGKR